MRVTCKHQYSYCVLAMIILHLCELLKKINTTLCANYTNSPEHIRHERRALRSGVDLEPLGSLVTASTIPI